MLQQMIRWVNASFGSKCCVVGLWVDGSSKHLFLNPVNLHLTHGLPCPACILHPANTYPTLFSYLAKLYSTQSYTQLSFIFILQYSQSTTCIILHQANSCPILIHTYQILVPHILNSAEHSGSLYSSLDLGTVQHILGLHLHPRIFRDRREKGKMSSFLILQTEPVLA
jgi:hypothetical protein